MEDARIRRLNDHAPDPEGDYVLYWMQQSQRAAFNHALEYAARRANELDQGVIVGFGLTDAYPDAKLPRIANGRRSTSCASVRSTIDTRPSKNEAPTWSGRPAS